MMRPGWNGTDHARSTACCMSPNQGTKALFWIKNLYNLPLAPCCDRQYKYWPGHGQGSTAHGAPVAAKCLFRYFLGKKMYCPLVGGHTGHHKAAMIRPACTRSGFAACERLYYRLNRGFLSSCPMHEQNRLTPCRPQYGVAGLLVSEGSGGCRGACPCPVVVGAGTV